jgi:hypothetical protein
MSPEQTLQQSLKDYQPPPRAESPVLLLQGWYYVIAGLWAASGLSTLQAPTLPGFGFTQMWEIRVIGSVIALIGVVLIRASKRNESVAEVSFVAIATALVLGILELVLLLNDQLPMTFLIDAGMQLGFLFWWAVATILGEIFTRHTQPSLTDSHRTA